RCDQGVNLGRRLGWETMSTLIRFPERVEYNSLPWKCAAGTPNILGTIVCAQALRILLDLALTPHRPAYFATTRPIEAATVRAHHALNLTPPASCRGPRTAVPSLRRFVS